MQTEIDYMVREPQQILARLSTLIRNDCIITTQIGSNKDSFLTAILELDPQRKILKLDAAPTEQLNQQLLNASKVLLLTELDGIQVAFKGQYARPAQFSGHPAIAMSIPDEIFWLQRRKFYRIKIPYFHEGSLCQISFKLNEVANGTTITGKFRLVDLSVNGFAFLNQELEFKNYFACNKAFDSGHLYLHESTHAPVCFVIKNISDTRTGDGIQQRVGCQITEISPAFESNIQIYMQGVERLKKNIADTRTTSGLP